MSDEESYEYEYDDDDMGEEGFQYTDEEEEANDGEVALGRLRVEIFWNETELIVMQLCMCPHLSA